GVDTRIFKPLSRSVCREILGMPYQGKAILFLSHVVIDNERKGSEHFLRAVAELRRTYANEFFVILVGEGALHWGEGLPCPVWRRDLLRDDELLAMIYNAADVLVHPAVVENLPNSVLEAMACGLPVVAFDTGGVAEVVEHEQTGYLAAHTDESQLVAGLNWVLADDKRRQLLGQAGRQKVLAEYGLQKQARSFLALYQQHLHRHLAA